MARSIIGTMPLDEPILIRPGVMHREADYHGNAKHYALPLDHPERAKKGDLPMDPIKDFDPKPIEGGGLPFKNLRSKR